MMHPDDYDKLMRICRAVTIVIIVSYSFKLGRAVFQMLGQE